LRVTGWPPVVFLIVLIRRELRRKLQVIRHAVGQADRPGLGAAKGRCVTQKGLIVGIDRKRTILHGFRRQNPEQATTAGGAGLSENRVCAEQEK